MTLTNSEMEAKLAALEDRVSILFQATNAVEWRLEHGLEMWEGWAVELQAAMSAVEKQIVRLREHGAPTDQE